MQKNAEHVKRQKEYHENMIFTKKMSRKMFE